MEAAGKLRDRDIFAHDGLVKREPVQGTEHGSSKSLDQDTVSCLDPLKCVLSILI
ncbi:mCG148036 [Mus musculus]|nr:mCG148036 [Mus musculus]